MRGDIPQQRRGSYGPIYTGTVVSCYYGRGSEKTCRTGILFPDPENARQSQQLNEFMQPVTHQRR